MEAEGLPGAILFRAEGAPYRTRRVGSYTRLVGTAGGMIWGEKMATSTKNKIKLVPIIESGLVNTPRKIR